MTEYALVDPNSQVATIRSDVDPTVQTKAGWKWLPVTRVIIPLGANQVYPPPVTVVSSNVVTITLTPRDKTAAELDAEKTARVDGLDIAVLQLLFNHENRIRTLAAQAPVTVAQFKAFVKGLLP